MPWLGDGTWVETNDEARRIVRGDQAHRPHGGPSNKARERQLERRQARKAKYLERDRT